jgi:hypothetical protein
VLLFWRGWGWLVLPILFGWVFVAIGIMIATQGPDADPNAAANTDRLFALVFVLSAATVFFLARWRNKPRQVVAPETGETQQLVHRDDFMFIPMKYYALVYAAVAVFLAVKSLTE